MKGDRDTGTILMLVSEKRQLTKSAPQTYNYLDWDPVTSNH